VAASSIIGSVDSEMALTMHLRGPVPSGSYRACLSIFYEREEPVDRAEAPFVISEPSEEGRA
jgi:hypothetical protein